MLYRFGKEDELDKWRLKRLAIGLSCFLVPEAKPRGRGRLFVAEGRLEIEKSAAYGDDLVLGVRWHRLELETTLGALLVSRSLEDDVERVRFVQATIRALDPRSELGVEREWGAGRTVKGWPKSTRPR